MPAPAIVLDHVSKKYRVKHEKPTLVENVLKHQRVEEFWALQNIDVTIDPGSSIGIYGPNGSGKTTLLKIISGITTPTQGTVIVNGQVASLISPEAGFHPELTGEENIYLNGLIIGMSKPEIAAKISQIIDFADISNFIDAPLYTYSDGMKIRLGFAIAIHSDPDILVLDEQVSVVGDQQFRKKSLGKVIDLFKQQKTVIMVNHYMEILKATCDLIIHLNAGQITKIQPNRKKQKLATIIGKYY